MLRALIIGCGKIAGGFDVGRAAGSSPLTHAGAYTADDRFELTACVDPDDSRRKAFAEHWCVPRHVADVSQLAGDVFDVVSICSPTPVHHADTLAALSFNPRLIFCEKPVCGTLEDTANIVGLCQDRGVLFAVNHNRRWDPHVQRLSADLRNGRWGRMRSAAGWYNKGVLNNGSHLVDLFQQLLGPLKVKGVGQPINDFWETDPTVPAILLAEGGQMVTLNAAHATDYSLFELQLVMERGVITMEDGGMTWRVREPVESVHFSGYRTLIQSQCYEGGYLQTMSRAVANIHEAICSGEPLVSTGVTAYQAQRICADILEMAKQAGKDAI